MEIVLKIKDIDDWKKVYPPAGKDKQWRDNYSAKEFAKAVMDYYPGSNFEKEIGDKLFSTDTFTINQYECYPERLTRFDNNTHGPRHHDLACIANIGSKKVALCFEAKVKESFDKPLASYRDSVGKKERVDHILLNFFNEKYNENYSEIYYQLLSAISGSIAFAAENQIEEVFFIVYQILPQKENVVSPIDKEAHLSAINDLLKKFGSAKIEKDGDVVDIGVLCTERLDSNNQKMKAHVRIAYLERIV